jgi:GNAT superfamily N-acetyltransferase
MKPYIETIWGWDRDWQAQDFAKAYTTSATYAIELDAILSGYFQVDSGEDSDCLRMLILKPDARSLGVGAKVLAEILSISRDSGRELMLRVFRINTGARRFYAREGWVVSGKDEAFLRLAHSSQALSSHSKIPFTRNANSHAFVVS